MKQIILKGGVSERGEKRRMFAEECRKRMTMDEKE